MWPHHWLKSAASEMKMKTEMSCQVVPSAPEKKSYVQTCFCIYYDIPCTSIFSTWVRHITGLTVHLLWTSVDYQWYMSDNVCRSNPWLKVRGRCTALVDCVFHAGWLRTSRRRLSERRRPDGVLPSSAAAQAPSTTDLDITSRNNTANQYTAAVTTLPWLRDVPTYLS